MVALVEVSQHEWMKLQLVACAKSCTHQLLSIAVLAKSVEYTDQQLGLQVYWKYTGFHTIFTTLCSIYIYSCVSGQIIDKQAKKGTIAPTLIRQAYSVAYTILVGSTIQNMYVASHVTRSFQGQS